MWSIWSLLEAVLVDKMVVVVVVVVYLQDSQE
jgi:hypothetical protein